MCVYRADGVFDDVGFSSRRYFTQLDSQTCGCGVYPDVFNDRFDCCHRDISSVQVLLDVTALSEMFVCKSVWIGGVQIRGSDLMKSTC